ncbi:preprotein translocase subunit SecE [Gynuella sunshinyii YC6258]|uniref:Protein translocase subunit SecE n=1 Tax=Gynuella sunshinyii YC6258 TaxID=1445510 RepID=A0A0C5W4R5_9GAMM|nr:preprotein translocase subunit SecE [Gynuella sunshinyii YC6258]
MALLLIAAIGGNYYFSEYSLLYRVLAVLALVLVAGFLGLQTNKGRDFNRLRKEAWVEVRKVVWPTRQETMQTTMIVVAVVVVVALLLWVIDTLLGFLIKTLIG